jgi:hypothetical protein
MLIKLCKVESVTEIRTITVSLANLAMEGVEGATQLARWG